jgi:hypothetical protein
LAICSTNTRTSPLDSLIGFPIQIGDLGPGEY